MTFQYQYEPLQNRPAYKSRKRSQFKVGFSATLDLLGRELGCLNARNIVIQADIERRFIRQDGMIYSNARPNSPAVAVAFQSKHGPLTYPCDTYDDWQDNLRAIALALEALRKVDRYGVSGKGEQYTGWARLPAPSANGSIHTRDEAMGLLRRIIGGRADVLPLDTALREAEMLTHPDKGGFAEDFKKVQEARKILVVS